MNTSTFKSKPITRISFNDPAPREIPGGMKFQVRYFNFYVPFGTFFFCFGMIFVLVFLGNADIGSLFRSKTTWQRTQGVIEHVNYTNASENHHSIYRYFYSAPTSEGLVKGDSYSSGPKLQEGDSVDVEYDPKNIQQSNIIGMRKAEFDVWVMFVLIFPIIGLVFMIIGVRIGKKNLNLLTNGILSTGKFVFKESTNTRINNQTVYKVTFEFKDQSGQMVRATAKTHKPHLVQDEANEPILYLADNPQNATMVDLLPKSVRKYLENSSNSFN